MLKRLNDWFEESVKKHPKPVRILLCILGAALIGLIALGMVFLMLVSIVLLPFVLLSLYDIVRF